MIKAQQGFEWKRSHGGRCAKVVHMLTPTPSPVQGEGGRSLIVVAGLLLVLSVVVVGCGDADAERRVDEIRRDTTEGQISLRDVVETFNHLYNRVSLEVEPPQVILDRRKTLDGEKALATFGRNPAVEDAPLSNYLTITSRNTRLKALDVQPGDQVQYFAWQDPLKEDPFAAGIGQAELEAVPMTVSQVVDDEHIIVEGGSPEIVDQDCEIQILRYVDDRSQDIREQLNAYAGYASPPLNWEPSPDEGEIENALNLLSQWMRHTHEDLADEPFAPPPLLDTLPESIRTSARLADYISPEALGHISFAKHEGRLLQQAVWLRNISNWARGDAVGDVELAEQLFDWTVRHIQLEVADPELAHHLARDVWEILLYGRGTAEQRAWVFVQLCRQQGLPAVLLFAPQGGGDESATPQFWCAAIVSQGQLYLFDPALGLPIPRTDGTGIATLADAAGDPEVLRQLDLGDDERYPWSHEDVEQVQAMIVASPLSLSRRAALLQEKLVGQSGFVIHDDSASMASMLGSHENVQSVALWAWPFEVLDRQLALGLNQNQRQRVRAALDFRVFAFEPHLWKARALHFRAPSEAGGEGRGAEDVDATDGHQDAIKLYQNAVAPSWDVAEQQSDEKRQTMRTARENAIYWLGLLKMDQGLTQSKDRDLEIAATSWFSQVLTARPLSTWLNGARFNLARIHEALGQTEEALKLYEQDDSLQRHGNLLRARRLRERQPSAEEPAES